MPVRPARGTRRVPLPLAALALAPFGLAGLALAGCSQAGSEGASRPTLSGSATVPAVSGRSPGGTGKASASMSTGEGVAPSLTGTAGAPGATSTGTSTGPSSTTATRSPITTTQTATATQTATRTTTATATQTITATRTATATQTTRASVAGQASPTPVPTAGAAPSGSDASSGSVPWWAWLLALAVVGGLVALIPVLAGRRRRALEAWDTPLDDAEDSARWLQDRVLPAVVAEPAGERSAATWGTVRPRFLALDEQLTDLARTAPDPDRRAMAASLRAALADVSTALEERTRAASPAGWSTADMRLELARDQLARRLRHEALVPAVAATGFPPGAASNGPVPTGPVSTGPVPAPSVVPRPTPPVDSSPPGDSGSGRGRHVQP